MYELIQVSDNCYYIQSPAKIGLVRVSDDSAVLIDSGNDKDAGRKVLKILNQQGWHLNAIYNTHSNADHIGGNKYLQDKTGCVIYAPDIEAAFTRHTILEPSFLYGGYPPSNLCHKFLMAQESNAQVLSQDVLPEDWELIDLPGHFFDMAGFRTGDGIVYLADCLSSCETLEKYKFVFIFNVSAYLETLERVKAMSAKLFIPAHADASENIAALAQANIDSVNQNADLILRLCERPVSFDLLLQKIFNELKLNMTYEQHALAGSTVKSYLSWLNDSGKLRALINNNILVWERV
ncbi:MAG: MBL fold metallo-hydrolase [Synergistaceae bacterium]|nr:MBL fold metallo-hydrolase [Synergistaceae bacterium]MBR0096474.1 MBL fold metallo-hydrolase [Synergistaceae bacterium]